MAFGIHPDGELAHAVVKLQPIGVLAFLLQLLERDLDGVIVHQSKLGILDGVNGDNLVHAEHHQTLLCLDTHRTHEHKKEDKFFIFHLS